MPYSKSKYEQWHIFLVQEVWHLQAYHQLVITEIRKLLIQNSSDIGTCPICKGEFPTSVLQYHKNQCIVNSNRKSVEFPKESNGLQSPIVTNSVAQIK